MNLLTNYLLSTHTLTSQSQPDSYVQTGLTERALFNSTSMNSTQLPWIEEMSSDWSDDYISFIPQEPHSPTPEPILESFKARVITAPSRLPIEGLYESGPEFNTTGEYLMHEFAPLPAMIAGKIYNDPVKVEKAYEEAVRHYGEKLVLEHAQSWVNRRYRRHDLKQGALAGAKENEVPLATWNNKFKYLIEAFNLNTFGQKKKLSLVPRDHKKIFKVAHDILFNYPGYQYLVVLNSMFTQNINDLVSSTVKFILPGVAEVSKIRPLQIISSFAQSIFVDISTFRTFRDPNASCLKKSAKLYYAFWHSMVSISRLFAYYFTEYHFKP